MPSTAGEGILAGVGTAIQGLDIVPGALIIVLGEAEEVLLLPPTGETAAEEDQQQT